MKKKKKKKELEAKKEAKKKELEERRQRQEARKGATPAATTPATSTTSAATPAAPAAARRVGAAGAVTGARTGPVRTEEPPEASEPLEKEEDTVELVDNAISAMNSGRAFARRRLRRQDTLRQKQEESAKLDGMQDD